MMLLAAMVLRAQSQIEIGGNVYGGGNAGNMTGNTSVTVRAGDLNKVFGGARQANVGGHTFVNIDGEHASNFILINYVYGGNDISGEIGTNESLVQTNTVPDKIEKASENRVDKTWNAFVRISSKTTTTTTGEGESAVTTTTVAPDNQKIYIGQLFGGGNGDYNYSHSTQEVPSDPEDPEGATTTITTYTATTQSGEQVASSPTELTAPELAKTYLEILGGSIVYAFGGGNSATVTEKTVIHVDNPSEVVNEIYVKDGQVVSSSTSGATNLLTDDRIQNDMGINLGFSYPSSAQFQIGSFFGGNNTAEMKIRPQWNLQGGRIRNLYSGGNRGKMTSPDGLLLQIPVGSTLVVDNVYGGCRMADVIPTKNGVEQEAEAITKDDFGNDLFIPGGMSARTRILGGHVNNVYGGNDITGRVAGGNSIGIYSTVYGDVYGGGNGSYPYTDNVTLKNDPIYGDLYYSIPTGKTSVEALNAFRPAAEQVSIYVSGKENKKTIVHGGIYLGGNSASLSSARTNPKVELKIGNYVIADNVFLGNNGEHMVETHEKDATHHNEGVLRTYKKTLAQIDSVKYSGNTTKFSQMVLTDSTTFAQYMDGVAMTLMPSVVFANKESNGDPEDYIDYSSSFGSFYCGGNVGSMKIPGKTTINFNHKVIIYNKLVGGCNNADVYDRVDDDDLNAEYLGGYIGVPDDDGNKLQLNLSGLKIQPMRWKKKREYYAYNESTQEDDLVHTYTPTLTTGESFDTDLDFTDYVVDANGNHVLEWNTVSAESGYDVAPVTTMEPFVASTDLDRRLKGGNVYGGCYNTGIVNGNVIINIDESLMERDKLFDVASDEDDCLYENTDRGTYTITKRNTGVLLSEQGMDVLGSALNVFGGGYGEESEIWGSTTINLNKGYVFQIFGGGEAGAVGNGTKYNPTTQKIEYNYDAKYSTYINLNGPSSGVARGASGDSPDMAECEFIYGGGFEGIIAGDTHIRLGNGRVFNTFAGSCNANILGHTETYVGEWTEGSTTMTGFPWIRDHIYGGNDLGGSIKGYADFTGRIRDEVKGMVHSGNKPKATAYMEYTQGRVRNILGGCFGDYDYSDPTYETRIATTGKPYLHNAFVNFRPIANNSSSVERIFGAGEGYEGDRDGDKSQDHSYVLIDIPDFIDEKQTVKFKNFETTEVFGAGAYDGLGMRWTAAETFQKAEPATETTPAKEAFDLIEASAVIDLMRGRIAAAYGGSLDEGVTRRTEVNVPDGSTIVVNNLFGGAYGNHILPPCDVYEANVNYRSAKARVNGKIYGGNNNVRRTIYATININVPVLAENGYFGTVYGAGKGMETWAEYTEVNLEPGAQVYEAYGGSEEGNVLNAESVEKYMQTYAPKPADKLLSEDDTEWKESERWDGAVGSGTLKPEYQAEWQKAWKTAWTIGDYYIPNANYDDYVTNGYTNLANTEFVRTAEMDDRDFTAYTGNDGTAAKNRIFEKYNTNVIINAGATVGNYAYGGGYGNGEALSGGVYGTTYIALLGGTVDKDIYAACTSGEVVDVFGAGAYSSSNTKGFTASANAYIQGGTCRNVYGAGWKGNVGSETIDGETHVVIGNKTGKTFANGIPAIQRNAYAGGEGETKNNVTEGSTVFGSANVTLYNGYIGYTYNAGGEDDPETTDIDEHYEEKLHDETATEYVSDDGIVGKNRLVEAGNIFGSGYVDHSDVDRSYVTVYDGVVRNSLYGGGEIGCVGRGNKSTEGVDITKGGATHVTMYGGLVMGDVFGGGRGYDNLQRVGILGTAGYIYGTTEVNIHRGRIGTESSVAEGHGNVFGGGNLGYVYGTGTKNASDGYYYNGSSLTEDCKVVVSPYVVVTNATTVNGHSYAVGDYVPTADLNTLSAGDSNWKTENGGNFDDLGITIGNAVFAGGNVSEGSDLIYANTNTVYGNATASIIDVFNKDLVAIGGDGVGGLYGDGNLTLVDGYRELNITNYGTDYYNLNSSISYEEYQRLNDRERAYFELQYQAKEEHTYSYYRSTSLHNYNNGDTEVTYRFNQKISQTEYNLLEATEKENWEQGNHTYRAGDKISQEDFELMDEAEQLKWDLLGFCTLYAGRIMNTIQRADFCGVFGSRIVLRGAQDRVPSVADYTNYTINRVDELSLNQVTKGELTHGNYFGIYNMVNYLGALTSDVKFSDVRTTANQEASYAANGTTSYYDWKHNNLNNRKRNNGSSLNEVALSSGVWLEILNQSSEKEKKKVYGPITGVVELALVNVATGEGGGYVYAKNMHGQLLSSNSASQVTLSAANTGAVSHKQYTYAPVTSTDKMQTSGNFVNSLKRIVDDCYPKSGSFYGDGAAPAHYWYIRGDFYLYDQLISAYTGSAQAYAEQVSIPLTITPESQGRLTLKDINENRYAYWTDEYPNLDNYKSQIENDAIVINDITYHKNDPISYWEYSRLNDAQKAFFKEKTYVSMEDMTLGTGTNAKTYTKGQVLTTAEYNAVPSNEYVCTTAFTATGEVNYEHGHVLTEDEYNSLTEEYKQHFAPANSLVHVSNAVSHDNGFLLSFAWDNPDVWNDYYHHLGTGDPQYVRSSKYDSDEFASSRDNYIPSPTFKCNTPGVYGRLPYQTGNLVDEQVYNHESASLIIQLSPEQTAAKADFEPAYVAKVDCHFTVAGVDYYYVAGAPISENLYNTFGSNQSYFERGYICTRTYQISDTEYILNGDVMTATAYNNLGTEQKAVMSPAYICTKDGDWGGKYFYQGTNYPAVEFSNLSEAERANFSYNYDALDLLSENFNPNGVSLKMYQGATHGITNQIPYCEKQPIDYTATYNGTEKSLTTAVEVTRGTSTLTTNTLQTGDVLTNTVYESLVNEQFHYSPIVVSGADADNTVYYVVNDGIQVADTWYNVGNKMSAEIYNGLTEGQKAKVTAVSRSSLPDLPTGNNTKSYYFCTSPYEAKTAVKDVKDNTTYNVGQTVPLGTIIGPEDNSGMCYANLKNEQTGFTIDGIIPTETSTLYVSRETDINDLSQDKIVTVEYWYEYVESDETGNSYETIRERHVVNVRIHFESGVPIIGELLPPHTILPGDVLGLNQPSVTKGAYEILGGGWETYSSYADAVNHKNGTPYTTNQTPMYWYQDGNYVAYYAKTYLGKTYSNAVQFSVANYHDMNRVMQDTEHHMYVDNPRVKRNSKIYIDSRECVSDPTKSELDLFRDFFDLSTGATLTGHAALDEHVKDCQNLDFILYSDVAPKAYTNWTSIGTDAHCFAGWLHGNGYTVSGLNNSLFGKLCGNIYNVGVMGSFTSGGIANSGSGHIENTWVSTTATSTLGKPIIGDVSGNPYVYNSYYPEEQNWTDHTTAANLDIIEKPTADFVNGQVAYLLNSNYLQARYLLFGNKSNAASADNKNELPVYFSYPDGTFDEETVEGAAKKKEYQLSYTKNPAEWPWHSGNGFVENYMGNGDYRYSDGIIPRQNDVSYTGTEHFIPVFPDDYIYFGQVLSYDLYNSTERPTHDLHPTGIVKDHTTKSGDEVDNSRHLLLTLDPKTANRVFRAPAYFRNGTFGKSAIFNASAAFAGSYAKDGVTYKPHEGLTAIDFTGKGDITGYSGVAPGDAGDYKDRSNDYAPLLDYYGLDGIKTDGITRNLLAYAPTADVITGDEGEAVGIAKAQAAVTSTLNVISSYFKDPVYAEKEDDATTGMKADYRAVDAVTEANLPKGHLVQMSGSFTDGNRLYSALNDHFLVDRQDFNAPISYTFDSYYRMWYQRYPDNYVDRTKGWEGVSLPFTAELVTTHQKGEITHFYSGSEVSKNGTGTKIGHEYWLRELSGELSVKEDKVLTAGFKYPNGPVSLLDTGLSNDDNDGDDTKKTVSNTFLWDYYYTGLHSQSDMNTDKYQKYYSESSRPYENYAYLTRGTPYIIGFPGTTYYEFDLGGGFNPTTTGPTNPVRLKKQCITFASPTGFTIGVSDNENAGVEKSINIDGTTHRFVYKPSYLNETFSVGDGSYTLMTDGSSFKVPEASSETTPYAPTEVFAFRPYFTYSSSNGVRTRGIEQIEFTMTDSNIGSEKRGDPTKEEVAGTLNIYAKKHKIIVESSLNYTTDVRIVNLAGITINSFTIEPGETIETRVNSSGVYIVEPSEARYIKKLSVR